MWLIFVTLSGKIRLMDSILVRHMILSSHRGNGAMSSHATKPFHRPKPSEFPYQSSSWSPDHQQSKAPHSETVERR